MNNLEEIIYELKAVLRAYLLDHNVKCHADIESYRNLYDFHLKLRFYIKNLDEDCRIRKLFQLFNINVIDSPLDPMDSIVLQEVFIGMRNITLNIEKTYELIAVLKLEGY